jgi:hypothetical protein
VLPLGRLTPPDSPDKWMTIKAALDDDAKTRRLARLLVIVIFPVSVISVGIAVAIVIRAIH